MQQSDSDIDRQRDPDINRQTDSLVGHDSEGETAGKHAVDAQRQHKPARLAVAVRPVLGPHPAARPSS